MDGVVEISLLPKHKQIIPRGLFLVTKKCCPHGYLFKKSTEKATREMREKLKQFTPTLTNGINTSWTVNIS